MRIIYTDESLIVDVSSFKFEVQNDSKVYYGVKATYIPQGGDTVRYLTLTHCSIAHSHDGHFLDKLYKVLDSAIITLSDSERLDLDLVQEAIEELERSLKSTTS